MQAGLDKLEVAIALSSLFMRNGGIVTCRHVVYTGVKMAGHWPTSSGSNIWQDSFLGCTFNEKLFAISRFWPYMNHR